MTDYQAKVFCLARIRNMEKETIEMPMKRGNGEKETVVCCIFAHACVFYAISTTSYSTFTSWYLIQQIQGGFFNWPPPPHARLNRAPVHGLAVHEEGGAS